MFPIYGLLKKITPSLQLHCGVLQQNFPGYRPSVTLCDIPSLCKIKIFDTNKNKTKQKQIYLGVVDISIGTK